MTNGMRKFVTIWFGQWVTMSGTAMTRFALMIWAYAETGQATTLALLGFSAWILYVVLSPIAGVLVDKWDRRTVMLAADFASGLMTAGILILHLTGKLEIWHLYVAETLTGAFDAFQLPAYTAATTTLVPKEQYGRVSGMRSMAYEASNVLAPPLAGLILSIFGLSAVLALDLLTFGVALFTLAITPIPRPVRTDEGTKANEGSFFSQMAFGFRFIFARQGLAYLALMFAGINFIATLTYYGVMNAMILARTGGDEIVLAAVQSALGIAGVIGGIVISIGGLPKRKIHAVLGFAAVSFLFGDFLFGVGRGVAVWIFASLVASFFIPFIVGANRAIWQAKVPADVQGRVFGVQYMLQVGAKPLGYLMAGGLADRVFGLALMPGGSLVPIFGGLVGTGAGAGMGLMFVGTALIGCVLSLGGYLIPAVRNVEDLPDAEGVMSDEPERSDATSEEISSDVERAEALA